MSKTQAHLQMQAQETRTEKEMPEEMPIAHVIEGAAKPNGAAPKAEVIPAPPQAVTPMALIEIAVNQNADVVKLEKLLELQLRWEANEARKAFVKALSAFKADPPQIAKNRTASFATSKGQVSYDYATLDEVCKQITQGLSRHGITHRWRVEQPDKSLIRVTCILTHELGHSEETSLCAGPDMSGTKNEIQAMGSAVTYLEKYTLLAATGLAARNGDNDGNGAPEMEGLPQMLTDIKESRTIVELQARFQKAFKEATRLANPQALKVILAAKDERKMELGGGR